MPPFLLAVDVGTSALKTVVYARDGQILAHAAARYGYATPQPGWAEADPEQWWQAFRQTLAILHRQVPSLPQTQALAFTGQMHTAVLLDEAGATIPPTILWLDRRAVAETAELQARLGLPPHQLNSTYTLPKLLWLARHRPDILPRIATVLWPKDYLRFRLTGEQLTDVTEAGGAALLDWQTLAWAGERLEMAGLDPGLLPPLRQPHDHAGRLLPAMAAELGLAADGAVLVGAGDVLALITASPPLPGQVTCSLGSSSMVFAPLPPDHPVADPTNRLYIYPLLPYPLLGGVSSTTGAALQWAWESLFGEETAIEDAIRQALAIPAGAEGLFFLPFLAGERSPFWNDQLRGSFYGLTLAHRRPHLLRAVLEGVAFSLRYLLDLYAGLGVHLDAIALAGGGSATPGWPQIIADVCRLPVRIYTGAETVTRGLYAFACQALGGEPFVQALARTFPAPVVLQPQSGSQVYDEIYRRYGLLADFAHHTLSASPHARPRSEPGPG